MTDSNEKYKSDIGTGQGEKEDVTEKNEDRLEACPTKHIRLKGRTGFQPVFCDQPVINDIFHPVNPWVSPTLNIKKRHLPHVFVKGATYFVTFRCRKGMILSEKARSAVLSAILYWSGKRIVLDAAVVMPDHVHMIFRIVMEADAERDRLEACPTTSNSFFVIKDFNSDRLESSHTIGKILHSIKSFSSHQINLIRNRKGSVWQDENFDHIIRNEYEWNEKIAYIIQNPVKKELVDKPSSYQWLWVSTKVIETVGHDL